MSKYAGWESFNPVEHVAARVKNPRKKYGNVPTEHDGITFASKREADRYVDLRALQASGAISRLEVQPQFALHAFDLNGTKHAIGRYIADFSYYQDGRFVVEDAKGMRTALYQWKKHHVRIEHGIIISEV
jgi:hypothetical protein